MKAAIVRLSGKCLLSEISKKYKRIKIYGLHRNSRDDMQRILCRIAGKKYIREKIISELSMQDSVEDMRLFKNGSKDTKIFLIINSARRCKTLDLINQTKSFGKDVMLYKYGIEEWVIYSDTTENLESTIKKLKDKNSKVKVERFFDLPIDMIFTRSFDLLSNIGLTKKQLEVLKMAWKLGYYDKQKKVNLDHIAKKFGVSEPTIWESLRCTEYKILSYISNYFSFDF